MTREPFIWDGIEIWTGAELIETVMLLADKDEADAFMAAYVEHTDGPEHAENNILYICGQFGDDGMEQLELFDIAVPEPGTTISPTQWFSNSSLGVKS